MTGAEILTRFTADTSQVDKATKNYTAGLGKLTTAFTLGNIAAQAISKTIGAFNQNLDSAISRFDTMNNFPKVMSNLGIGADDANKSIDTLSEKLQGLPTSLDSAAMAVQRLTSKNGDVDKSTQLFLALNNAILAGGAGAEIQKSAIEQMSQAYAKGRPDMMEWRTMMMAMPAQLKQVATAMGYVDADALGEALRKGWVSMDKFMDTVMKLNTEGIPGFANFETQARNATGGVATSITNMKTAMARGVAGMIGSIDGALKDFGGLSGVIQKIGKVGEKIFKSLGEIIASIIPKIVNMVNFFKEHKGLMIALVGIVGSLVAVLTTYKTIMSVINTIQAVQNALLLANPAVAIISAIIVAVGALVAGVMWLWKNCEGFRNFFINMWNGFKKVISTVVNFVKKNWKTMLKAIINPFGTIFKLLYDKCEGFRNVVNNVVNAVKGFFVNAGQWFYTTVIQPIMNVVNGILNFVKNIMILIVAAITIPIDWLYKNVFAPIGTWINDNVLKPTVEFFINAFNTIRNFVVNAFNTIKEFVIGVIESIKAAWNTVSSFIWDNVLSPVVNFFSNTFNTIWGIISRVIDKIKGAFEKVKGAIITAFTAVKDFIKNVFSTIGNIIKAPINAIIGGINKVLQAINSIQIPDWVPGIGGAHTNFGMIPQLNVGTNYVPEDTLAMIHKGEAVIPKKFNPYANGVNAQTIGTMNASTPTINVQVYNDIKQDPLGQMVSNIKTFSGGSKNDYNYGMGN